MLLIHARISLISVASFTAICIDFQHCEDLIRKVGVISPYRAQVSLIRRLMSTMLPELAAHVEVKYVHTCYARMLLLSMSMRNICFAYLCHNHLC
jgi:hypothetical protein